MSLIKVLDEVAAERARQDAKWGVQDWPSVSPSVQEWPAEALPEWYKLPSEDEAKRKCEGAFFVDEGSYAHIAVEEICEAIGATDDKHRREELIQLAAVCVAWVEAIDRRALAAQGLEML